jgi:hypothetical protein
MEPLIYRQSTEVKLIYTHHQMDTLIYRQSTEVKLIYTHPQMETFIYRQSTEVKLIHTPSNGDIDIQAVNWGQIDTHTIKWRH